jgi:hypothetical protein
MKIVQSYTQIVLIFTLNLFPGPKHVFSREDMAIKAPYLEPNTELSVGWVAPKNRNPVSTGRNVSTQNV